MAAEQRSLKQETLHPSWEQALEEHKEAAAVPERHEEIREALHKRVGKEIERVPPLKAPPSQVPVAPLPVHPRVSDIAAMPQARQVVALAQIALTEGIEPAVELARNLGSAYVIDALHDVLVDKLFEELVKRGKLHYQ